MGADIAVFHSSIQKEHELAVGWWIGAFRGDDLRPEECCVGPYPTKEQALDAMSAGAWLHG